MIKIFVETDPRYKVNNQLLKLTALNILKKHRIKGKVEMGIVIVGDRKMQELNRTFRHLDETTDVLAFPLEDASFEPQADHKGFVNPPDNVLRLGDVVISYPQAAKSAAENGVTIDEELVGLVEHGVSHLLGIHHN